MAGSGATFNSQRSAVSLVLAPPPTLPRSGFKGLTKSIENKIRYLLLLVMFIPLYLRRSW